jgi:hypothetical protein
MPHAEKSGDGTALIGGGIKPLKRGRCGSDASAPKALKHHEAREGRITSGSFEERVVGLPISGGAQADASKQALCLLQRSGSQSQEGKLRRKACAISVR